MRSEGLVAVLLLVITVSVVSPARAHSEAGIRGQLVAQADQSALAEGTVTLKSIVGAITMETQVDRRGRFTFSNVPPGEYFLSGSSKGFANGVVRLTVAPREGRDVMLALGAGPDPAFCRPPEGQEIAPHGGLRRERTRRQG
jgi:carboxypeptidase family protein